MVMVPASRIILLKQNGSSEQNLPAAEYPSAGPALSVQSIALSGSTGKQGNYLNAGDLVQVTATFNAAAIVTGAPQLTLTIGSTARTATYLGGSGTSALVFIYTIQAGDNDGDGIAIPANAISLNGGTIKTSGGTDAVLTSAPVAANPAYLVDTAVSPPTINVVAGNDVINASEATSAISGTAEPNATVNLTLGTGNLRTVTANGSGNWSYTLVSADITAMGQGAETISATQTDPAGNTSSAATRAITIDTVAPTITSVALSGAGATNDFLNVGDTATMTVVFDSVVSVTGTPQMALTIGAATRQANYLSGSGSNTILLRYSIQSGDTDANGISGAANSLSLNGGSITDAAGNPANLTHGALTDNPLWKVDTTAPVTPTVALGAGVADGATHAEATAGTGVITVSAETGSAIAVTFSRASATVSKSATGTGSPVAIVLTEGDLTTLGDGTISVSITATDLAGNVSAAATTSFELQPDVPTEIADLRYSTANSRWEVFNASSFPGATYVYKSLAGATLATTTNTYLAGTATDDGITVEVQGRPDTKSVVCFKRANTRIFDINLADYPDGTLLNSIPGVQCVNGFTIQGGKISVPSKITTPITFVAGGGSVAQPGSFLNQTLTYQIDNNDITSGSSYESARMVELQKSASGRRIYVETRGEFGVAGRQRSGVGDEYKTLIPFVTLWDGFQHIPNGSIFQHTTRQIDGVPYFSSLIKKTGGSFKRWGSGNTGAGIAYNATGTALEPGNAVTLCGVSTDYNGTNYPKTLYQGRIIVEQSAPVSINVYDAIPTAPDISNPLRIQMIGHSTLTGTHEACVVDQDGRQRSPFQTFTTTSNLFDFMLPAPDDVLDLSSVDVLLRKVGVPDSAVVWKDVTIPAWRPIVRDYALGINPGSIGSSSPLIFRDLMKKIRWVYGTINGYQLTPDGTGLQVPLAHNGLPTGQILDDAWNYVGHADGGARHLMPILIEGDESDDGMAYAIGGSVMPYGTAGSWTFAYSGTPGAYTFSSGFRGTASPFSAPSFSATGFTTTVTQNGVAGPVTTWVRMTPTENGGKGSYHADGVPLTFKKTGDASTELLLDGVIASYGREKIIRPMHEHMGGMDVAAGQKSTYPFNYSPWADMDHALELVEGYGPQARLWMCQPPYRIETSPGSGVLDPKASVLRMFQKWAVDRQKLYTAPTYSNPVYGEPGNEPWNPNSPYGAYNAAFRDIGEALGFFSGMSAGSVKDFAQKYAGVVWTAEVMSRFFNEGIVPDLTGLGFPDLSEFANPAQALNGQMRTVVGLQGNSKGFMTSSQIASWFTEVGGGSHVYAIAPSTYFYIAEDDATLLSALDANDITAAVNRIHAMASADAAVLCGLLAQKSLEYKQALPWLKLLIYEGRWHNDPYFSTSTRATRYLQASLAYCATDNYKNVEKSVIEAAISAGFEGQADFVAFEGFATATNGNRWQKFGILSDAGTYINPATAAAQKAAIARDEIHDLVEAWT